MPENDPFALMAYWFCWSMFGAAMIMFIMFLVKCGLILFGGHHV